MAKTKKTKTRKTKVKPRKRKSRFCKCGAMAVYDQGTDVWRCTIARDNIESCNQ